MAKPKKIKFEIDHSYGTNPYKGLEYFCSPENFEKVGIAKGKKVVNDDGKITVNPGGNFWYVRHLDKALPEKQLFTSEVFNKEILNILEPLIYKYFDYSSFEEQQLFLDKMDMDSDVEGIEDTDFESIDQDDLFN
jgi:hypothetical protein